MVTRNSNGGCHSRGGAIIKKIFAYQEPQQALNARISAHAKYSNFNLHEWIKKRFEIHCGDRILDLGCGNGNFTYLFWDFVQPSGVILGMDKNRALIEEAKTKYAQLPKNKVRFLLHDFDKPFPDLGMSYEWIFSIYSLYYTEDSLKLLRTLKKQLAPGGVFAVIGPGPQNTKDMMDLNYYLTGQRPGKEHVERIERIAKEFKPLFEKLFSKEKVRYEEVDSAMQFPDVESYVEYYTSTLLWRESVKDLSEEKVALIKGKMRKNISLPAQIKKQMSCLVGYA